VALLIQDRIQDLDNSNIELATEDSNSSQNLEGQIDTTKVSRRLDIGRIILGSLQPTTTFQQIEDTHQNDIAFKYFHVHLNRWLTEELRVHNLRPQDASPVLFQGTDEVFYLLILSLFKLTTK